MSDRLPDERPARAALRCLGVALACLLAPLDARGGAFIFAGEANGIDLVTHPTGYSGGGGTLDVSVCIDPTSANAVAMETPVRNIVHTWNQRAPTTGNVLLGGNNDVPSGRVDFESVALHEVGHCIGLAHPNLASESGLSGSPANGTRSTDGANNSFESSAGPDGRFGSSDDPRGDDVNLHWFRISNNNPFTIADTVDSSTYSRDVADLPPGDVFAANADRSVATLLGVPNSEAVMQQGTFFDEDQRRLVHDDVATLEYGMSGIDEVADTGDDYTVNLVYGGFDSSCDVVLDFDNTQTGFAVCQTGGVFVGSGHARITSADIFFNTGFNWHFNTTLTAPEVVLFEEAETGTGSGTSVATGVPLGAVDDDLYIAAISTQPDVSVASVAGLGLVWSEAASQCSADGETGISLWTAAGSPTGDGSVSATLAASATNAVIAVTRYSGSAALPATAVVGNANGVAGSCGGGPDTTSYAFDVTTDRDNAVVLGAVAKRNRFHTPGIAFMERAEVLGGSGSSAAGVAIEDRAVNLAGTVSVQGSFDGPVDWAFAGLAIEVPECETALDCDDAEFCNGLEVCAGGLCASGSPIQCDDGVGCTDDACNEGTDSCDFLANDASCGDGVFCNGAETCDPALDCQAGAPVVCSDGVECTFDVCFQPTDACLFVPSARDCDDGDACTAESCDAIEGCTHTPIPGCGTSIPLAPPWAAWALVAGLALAGLRYAGRRPRHIA